MTEVSFVTQRSFEEVPHSSVDASDGASRSAPEATPARSGGSGTSVIVKPGTSSTSPHVVMETGQSSVLPDNTAGVSTESTGEVQVKLLK